MRRRRGHEPRDGLGGHALAAAAFAHQADGLARINDERYAVNRPRRPGACAEIHFEIFDFEQVHEKSAKAGPISDEIKDGIRGSHDELLHRRNLPDENDWKITELGEFVILFLTHANHRPQDP